MRMFEEERWLAMSLEAPDKIRDLSNKLYRKAKNEPNRRFHQLYDKVYREYILSHAYALAKANEERQGWMEELRLKASNQ